MKIIFKFALLLAMSTILITPSFAIMESARPTDGKSLNYKLINKAMAEYNQAIATNPNDEDAYIKRAYVYYITDDIKAAIVDYDTIIRINPKNEEFYLNRGYLKHISNDREGALEDYNAALRINPRYAFAYNNRGVALEELGNPTESLEAYDTAIKLDPKYADAYYNRGSLKTRNENNEEALEDFNKAIALNPSDSASYNNRGVVKRKLNFNVGALSDFSIAIKINPEDMIALTNRGKLKKRYFDSEGAEEDFKLAVDIAETTPTLIKQVEIESLVVHNTRSTTNVQVPEHNIKPTKRDFTQNENILAVNNIKKQNISQTKTNDTNIGTSSTPIIKTSLEKQDVNTNTPARQISQSPITTKPVPNPKLAECYYIRALQKYILQNRNSALSDFDMAIQHNPDLAEAYYYRAAIKRDLKDESFVADYQKAVSINPSLKNVNEADVLNILKI